MLCEGMAVSEYEQPKNKNLAEKMAKSPIKLKNYNNEKNLMLYPFCSTSKKKRITPINYVSEDGTRWLEVTANNTYGMAKIWDFDILRFVFSKIALISKKTGHYPNKITFTAYECLKALHRNPKSGKNLKWLGEALDRLTSTGYKGNIFREETRRVMGFTLIKYDYEESNEGIEKINITLDERIIESIKNSGNLLNINTQLIKEAAGIKKRLHELIDVNTRDSAEWCVSIEHLQKLCANDWSLARFKHEISTYNDLPWVITFEKEAMTTKVIFKSKETETEVYARTY